MTKDICYRKNNDCYYKVNGNLKRITKVDKSEVSYLDYDTFISEVKSYKPISSNRWRQVENSFFLSRDFEWEYNNEKFRTNNKPIDWKKGKYGGWVSLVFHNGKIWEASNNGNYYPRISLVRELYVSPTRTVLVEKKNNIIRVNAKARGKWTHIKFCRNFEKIS